MLKSFSHVTIVWPHCAEAPSEYHGFCPWTDNELFSLILHPLWGSESRAVSSYTLSCWQRVNKVILHPALGDCRPTALRDAMVALLPEDGVPGSLFLSLFLKRLPIEMRDLLAARDFKSSSGLALHSDKLWDANSAQAKDSLLAAAAASPARTCDVKCTCDRGYFHKRLGSSVNNCRSPCS